MEFHGIHGNHGFRAQSGLGNHCVPCRLAPKNKIKQMRIQRRIQNAKPVQNFKPAKLQLLRAIAISNPPTELPDCSQHNTQITK